MQAESGQQPIGARAIQQQQQQQQQQAHAHTCRAARSVGRRELQSECTAHAVSSLCSRSGRALDYPQLSFLRP